MLNRNDPYALRWLLGAQIAAFRHKTGNSLGQLSESTGFSRAKLGTMETGRFGQNAKDVSTVLKACGVGKADIDRLTAMAARIEGRPWWQPWKDVLPEWFRLYVGLEGLATSQFTLEAWVVPGILQTERYAAGVTRATALVRPDHVDRFAEFRVQRAARLTDVDSPMKLHAVLSETALRVFVEDAEVMAQQYDSLLSLTKRDNITVQVLRPESGPRPIGAGRFTMLEFGDALPVAFSELIDDATYVADPTKVRSYQWATKQLASKAESPEDSVAFIQALRDKLLVRKM